MINTWKKLSVVLQAALIAFAVQMQYAPMLNRVDYESWIDYFYAQITGLLGKYNFNWVLIFLLVLCFLYHMREKKFTGIYKSKVLPCFFSFCLLVGQSYAQEGNWNCCFGDVFHTCAFLVAFAGYSTLFHYLIVLFMDLYQKAAVSKCTSTKIEVFLGKNCFWNVFLLLLVLWTPVIILSYPGNLCDDFLWQMSQALGMAGYFSNNQPLLHTLIAGGIVRASRKFIGDLNVGLFLYIILQAAILAAALAATVARLTKRGISCVCRVIVLFIYIFAPMYSNLASTAIKDGPFLAAFLWYILLLEDLTAEKLDVGGGKISWHYWIKLVLAQVLVSLLRNNGVYVVVLTGIVLTFVYKKKMILLCTVILPLALYIGSSTAMTVGLSAERVNFGKMLSIPFQQTARYVKLYGNELTVEERGVIEGVLTDVDLVAEKYDPDISDPICGLYLRDSGRTNLASYFKVWAVDFFKHPAVYAEAFLVHVYGWFDPGVNNVIRYEAHSELSELFRQGGLVSGADEALRLFYQFVEYIPFLAVLENVGVYTWLLFLLGGMVGSGRIKRGVLLTPLFVSLLICMAAPCFYLHPRYAFPIMFSIPFLYGILGEDIGGKFYEPKASCI